MPDKDIFDKEDNTETDDITNTPVTKDDEITTDQLLAKIVNADGTPKYKSDKEALIALQHAQEHIKTLEADNVAWKAKGDPSEKLDELLAAVKNQPKGSGKDDNVSAIKPEEVLSIVKEYLDDTKASESKANNINMVAKAFKDRFGKDASDKLYGKAKDLGFTRNEINSMIATNPNAALTVLGVDMKKVGNPDIVSTNGGVDSSHFQGHPEKKPISVMDITSDKELSNAFKDSQKRTLERLGLSKT